MEPNPLEIDTEEKHSSSAAACNPESFRMPADQTEMGQDFQETNRLLEALVAKSILLRKCPAEVFETVFAKYINEKLSSGQWEKLSVALKNKKDRRKMFWFADTGKLFNLLGHALTYGNEPFAQEIFNEETTSVEPDDKSNLFHTTASFDRYDESSPLKIALLNPSISVDFTRRLLEQAKVEDSDAIGLSNEKPQLFCNFLGHTGVSLAKKQLILESLHKKHPYEMTKRALLLSNYNKENAVQTLLAEGLFNTTRDFDLSLNFLKPFVSPETLEAIRLHRQKYQALTGKVD